MKFCRPKKKYYVHAYKIQYDGYGGWSNFIHTTSLARAKYFAKKLPLKNRQIDVREWGKKPYVLKGSWL